MKMLDLLPTAICIVDQENEDTFQNKKCLEKFNKKGTSEFNFVTEKYNSTQMEQQKTLMEWVNHNKETLLVD